MVRPCLHQSIRSDHIPNDRRCFFRERAIISVLREIVKITPYSGGWALQTSAAAARSLRRFWTNSIISQECGPMALSLQTGWEYISSSGDC